MKFKVTYTNQFAIDGRDDIQRTVIEAKDEADARDIFAEVEVIDVTPAEIANDTNWLNDADFVSSLNCVCGHSAFDHKEGFLGHGTTCDKCDCRRFRLPAPKPAQLVVSTTARTAVIEYDADYQERRDLYTMGMGG